MSYDQSPQPPNEPPYQFAPTPPPYFPPPLVPVPRPRRQSHIRWIILSVFGVCALLVGCLGVLVVTGTLGSGGVSCSQSAGSTPNPAGLRPISAPVLGATVHDFCLRYGLPSNYTTPFTFGSLGLSWQVSTITGYQVDMLITNNDSAGDSLDGRPRIDGIELDAPIGVTWDSVAQQQIMAVFIPADARLQTVSDAGGDYERIYISAQLAATFAADSFTNGSTGMGVAPGTFSESCFLSYLGKISSTIPAIPTNTTGPADTCTIGVGT